MKSSQPLHISLAQRGTGTPLAYPPTVSTILATSCSGSFRTAWVFSLQDRPARREKAVPKTPPRRACPRRTASPGSGRKDHSARSAPPRTAAVKVEDPQRVRADQRRVLSPCEHLGVGRRRVRSRAREHVLDVARVDPRRPQLAETPARPPWPLRTPASAAPAPPSGPRAAGSCAG